MKHAAIALIALLLGVHAPVPAQEMELLKPDDAFALSARVSGDDTIEASWKIADGYYMYRDKFKFELDGEGISLKQVELPAGKRKKDDFFGEVEIYTKSVKATLTFARTQTAAQTVTLSTTGQGCNDPIGVCYPPLNQQVRLQLPAVAQAQPQAEPAVRSLTSLRSLLDQAGGQGTGGQEFLDPDKAFVLTVDVLDGRTLRAKFAIADGYYLYQDKTKFESASDDIALGPYTLPKGKLKVDEYFGKKEVYYKSFSLDLPLERKTAGVAALDLRATYQGCADNGICYPPIDKQINLTLPAVEQAAAGPAPAAPAESYAAAEAPPVPTAQEDLSEEERITAILSDSSLWMTIGVFFILGLGLAFTPCVFPMFPILSGIIVGHGKAVTHRKGFVLSLAYVMGMAITYTIAGVIAGLTGELLSTAFQNPWVLGAFALIFVLLSLSMFGFYELQLPTSLQAKLSATSNRLRGGALGGVFVMGVLSALIVGPCIAAPLSGALLYIGQTGDVALGGGALFSMSLGMGVPLLVVGTSVGTLMPKAGTWMDSVKAVFGVLLLGVAVWMISRVIPVEVTMILYAVLLIVPAIYMRALDPLPEGVSGWRKLAKGIGLVMLLYGIMLLIGAFTGANDPLDPLAGIRAPSTGAATVAPASSELEFKSVKGPEQLNARLAEAGGRPVMLDFYADWCVECVRLENTTFRDPGVRRTLADYVLLRADVTLNDDRDKALLKRFKLYGPPALLFFGSDGKEQKTYRVIGYINATEFVKHLAEFGQP